MNRSQHAEKQEVKSLKRSIFPVVMGLWTVLLFKLQKEKSTGDVEGI